MTWKSDNWPHDKAGVYTECHNALLRAIHYGIGGKELAESILYIQVEPFPAGEKPQNYVPLLQTERYI